MWKSKYVENCVDIFGLSGTTKIIDIIYTGLSEHRMEYPMYGIRVATSIGNFMINHQTISNNWVCQFQATPNWKYELHHELLYVNVVVGG